MNASGELAALREKTQRLLALQRAFVDCTPVELAELTKASRVGYLKTGTLYLLADNTTVAAKLRQLLPRLLPVFRKIEAEVNGIRVDVQPKSPAAAPATQIKKYELPIDYMEKIETIAKTISNPDLKLAVTRLMRNRKQKP